MTGILFLVLSTWTGGLLTFRFRLSGDSLWEKWSAAFLLGTLFSTWVTFLLALSLGFNRVSLFLSLFLMGAGAAVLGHGRRASAFWKDFSSSSLAITWAHGILLILVMPLFLFGLRQTATGDIVFLGNYTDMSYHLSMISSFLDQATFPPENPQSAGTPLHYHYLVNFHAAILKLGGLGTFPSLILPQILFAFALATALHGFYREVLGNRSAALFSILLFMLGHIGFFNLLFAFLGHPAAPFRFNPASWGSLREHMLYPFFNFLDPIINYFHPQRPFLVGFPLALIVMTGIYGSLVKMKKSRSTVAMLSLTVGLMPLFHMHSFLVIAPIFAISVALLRFGWKNTILCLLPLAFAAVQIGYLQSQPKDPSFSGFDVGRLGGGLNALRVLDSLLLTRVVFWIRAAGFPLLLGLGGVLLHYSRRGRITLQSPEGRRSGFLLLLLVIPFLYFLLINFYRFSPSWGDSNKFFLYLDLALCVFAAELLAALFRKSFPLKIVALTILGVAAVIPSSIELYTIFTRSRSPFYSACDRNLADWVRLNTARDAIFVTGDDLIHYLPALAGRRVVNGAYTWQTGSIKAGVEEEVQRIYRTGDPDILQKHGARYILVGPHEKRRFRVDEKALSRYKLIYKQHCGGISYRIYDAHQEISKNDKLEREKTTLLGKGKTPLSALEPISARQDHGMLQTDANFQGGPLRLNDREYEFGLGTHANSEIRYRLQGNFSFFESDVGLDDSEDRSPGSVVFKVYVDGDLRYQSPVLRWDSEVQHVRIDVRNADELLLKVEDGVDGDTCDHADWAGALLW